MRAAYDSHVALRLCGLTIKGDENTNTNDARCAEDYDRHDLRVYDCQNRIREHTAVLDFTRDLDRTSNENELGQ